MKTKAVIAIILVILMVLSVGAIAVTEMGNPHANAYGNSSFYPNIPPGNGLNATINNHFKSQHNYGAKLKYSASSGLISGKYMNSKFKNGIFTNVTYNLTSKVMISSMYATGTSISSSTVPGLFSGNRTIGSMFIAENSSSFFVLHNNPASESNVLVNNGTLYLTIPSGATIYNTTDNTQVTASANASMNSQVNGSLFNSTASNNMMFGFNHKMNAGKNMIIIDNKGTIMMMFIHNGSFTITKNKIKISNSKGPLMVNFVIPPGMQNLSKNHAFVKNIINGKISSEIALNRVNGTTENNTVNYNSSVFLKYTGNASHEEMFDVNSPINNHTIVSIFISNSTLANTGHIYLKFDGKLATYVNESALLNETSTTQAYYSYVNSSAGMYVLLYIPHFSNHTVDVYNVSPSSLAASLASVSYTDYYIIGGIIAAIAIIGVAAVVVRKRK